jgi:hypothetical protein
VLSPRKSVLPPLVVARCGSSSARIWSIVRGEVGDDHTPVFVEHLAMSAGEGSEPTVRTAMGIMHTILLIRGLLYDCW